MDSEVDRARSDSVDDRSPGDRPPGGRPPGGRPPGDHSLDDRQPDDRQSGACSLDDRSLVDGRAIVAGARRIVAFSGAGLSAGSGIATFRDPGEGLWARFDPMRLASPEGFAEDPETVLEWYAWRRRKLANAQPNAGHRALAIDPRITNVTQNVDDLLERAGATGVVHLHGRIGRDRCHRGCGHDEPIDLADPPPGRACPACSGPMRPAVVWFGEALPEDEWTAAIRAIESADAMLVVGTSAAVHPAAGLIGLAARAGVRVVVVNHEATVVSGDADAEVLGPAELVLPRLLADH